jgi:FlhB-like protein
MPDSGRIQGEKRTNKIDNVDTPVVLASGSGYIAQKIVEAAERHGIYIKEDQLLAESLSRLRLGQAIPPELYKAVAQVLAFVYSLDAAAGE